VALLFELDPKLLNPVLLAMWHKLQRTYVHKGKAIPLNYGCLPDKAVPTTVEFQLRFGHNVHTKSFSVLPTAKSLRCCVAKSYPPYREV
jgi:hypothetical protein